MRSSAPDTDSRADRDDTIALPADGTPLRDGAADTAEAEAEAEGEGKDEEWREAADGIGEAGTGAEWKAEGAGRGEEGSE